MDITRLMVLERGYAAKEGDARRFHPKLRPPVQPQELEIDPRTGMKVCVPVPKLFRRFGFPDGWFRAELHGDRKPRLGYFNGFHSSYLAGLHRAWSSSKREGRRRALGSIPLTWNRLAHPRRPASSQ